MDIFVSWAGRDSHAVALFLRQWLPEVLPFVRPWVSSEDIRKGTRWSDELWGRLQKTSYSIVCLTPAAVRSPWVNFEAGAVARAVGERGARQSPLCWAYRHETWMAFPWRCFSAPSSHAPTSNGWSGPSTLWRQGPFRRHRFRCVFAASDRSFTMR